MITRSGRSVLEDIRSYWGEMIERTSEAHGPTEVSAFAPDGPALDGAGLHATSGIGVSYPGELASPPSPEGLKL
jgi:hypothetical protein